MTTIDGFEVGMGQTAFLQTVETRSLIRSSSSDAGSTKVLSSIKKTICRSFPSLPYVSKESQLKKSKSTPAIGQKTGSTCSIKNAFKDRIDSPTVSSELFGSTKEIHSIDHSEDRLDSIPQTRYPVDEPGCFTKLYYRVFKRTNKKYTVNYKEGKNGRSFSSCCCCVRKTAEIDDDLQVVLSSKHSAVRISVRVNVD